MWSSATIGFRATFEGPDALAMIARAQDLGWAPSDLENGLYDVDHVELEEPEPIPAMLARARRRFAIDFPEYPKALGLVSPRDPVMIHAANVDVAIDMPEFARQLATMPFELAVMANLHLKRYGDRLAGDPRITAAPLHNHLGWAIAFRGRGHDRLVSRRWLRAGPWKLWQHADVSVVQFHALDADLPTSLAQALRGYALFDSDAATTGLPYPGLSYPRTLPGRLDVATRTMRVTIDAAPTDEELLAWAAARFDAVAFEFPTHDLARAQLARVWPYGHQVWARGERIDTGYTPPDLTPRWARP